MSSRSIESNVTRWLDRTDDVGKRILWVLFGDRVGIAVFLAAIVAMPLTWRIGLLSSDNYIIANSVVALADGHLHVEQFVFGPPDSLTPGASVVDGQVYGRNYGIVVPATLLSILIETLSLAVDLRLLFVGIWVLGVLGLVTIASTQFGLSDRITAAGGVLTLTVFLVSVVLAQPLPTRWSSVIALQSVTILAAAFLAVLVYRLLSSIHGRRLGAMAGIGIVVATPIGLWAQLPKRHSVTALLVGVSMFALYRSRSANGERSLHFRGLAYAAVGMLAWVHAAEGLVLLLALVLVDVPTAHRNGPRELAFVGGVFLLSLLPFFLTNLAISGSPVKPPRLFVGGFDTGVAGSGSSGAGGGGGSTATPEAISSFVAPFAILFQQYADSFWAVLSGGGKRLTTVFLRSGYIASRTAEVFRTIDLSLLESMPLLGATITLPMLAWRQVRSGVSQWSRSPVRITDAFVLVVAVLWIGLYFGRLPLHHQYTVRYLHPLYLLGTYALARTPLVRTALTTLWRRTVRVYATTVVLGSVTYLLSLWHMEAVLSEGVQLYGLVAFGLGLAVAFGAVVSTLSPGRRRFEFVVVGVATGAVTVYLLVNGFVLFAYTDNFALPFSRIVAESLRPLNPFGHVL